METTKRSAVIACLAAIDAHTKAGELWSNVSAWETAYTQVLCERIKKLYPNKRPTVPERPANDPRLLIGVSKDVLDDFYTKQSAYRKAVEELRKTIPEQLDDELRSEMVVLNEAMYIAWKTENARIRLEFETAAYTACLAGEYPKRGSCKVRVRQESGYAFNSQTSPRTYQLAALEVEADIHWRPFGIPCEIRQTRDGNMELLAMLESGDDAHWGKVPHNPSLYGRDEPVDLFWAALCWKHGANPKVFNPWLSDEISEAGLSLSAAIPKPMY